MFSWWRRFCTAVAPTTATMRPVQVMPAAVTAQLGGTTGNGGEAGTTANGGSGGSGGATGGVGGATAGSGGGGGTCAPPSFPNCGGCQLPTGSAGSGCPGIGGRGGGAGSGSAGTSGTAGAGACNPQPPPSFTTNYVTNPGFENGGASGWGISGVNGFEVTTSAFHCGAHSGKRTARNYATDGFGYAGLQSLQGPFKFSLWVMQNGGSNLPISVDSLGLCTDSTMGFGGVNQTIAQPMDAPGRHGHGGGWLHDHQLRCQAGLGDAASRPVHRRRLRRAVATVAQAPYARERHDVGAVGAPTIGPTERASVRMGSER